LKVFDVAIVGAGPAGMAAAIEIAEAGLSAVVLDEQSSPGGQVHRAIERRRPNSDDDRDGAALVAAFRKGSAEYWPGAAVWQVERSPENGFTICLTRAGETLRLDARRLIVATGALERPVPVPGWTLPGVMTVGAAQILLKTGGNVPFARVVIAGQGPLPLLYATQLLKAGVQPTAFLETTPPGALRRALPHLFGALANIRQLVTGLRYLADIRDAGVPIIRSIDAIEALGDGRLASVRYRAGGEIKEMAADLLLLHEGVVPHAHLAMSLGVPLAWDAAQLCWRPVLGEDGGTSVAGLRIAGDGAGINGWRIAEMDGRLAGLAVVEELGGKRTSARHRDALRKARKRLARLRPFLDAWYRPRQALLAPADEVIVCRCEERTAADVRGAVRQGCLGPTQVKTFTRCGMGPCQGRECGLTLTTLIVDERRISPEEAGYLRIRPPLKPVTLGELASLAPPGSGRDNQAI
jgi:NADPH-dependent 2,4-dienoyl-CoA reductase/sulfur reductase-like enzyme